MTTHTIGFMAKKTRPRQAADSSDDASMTARIKDVISWMSRGVYEKDQIVAMALLCAVAGENMFLLGPPGTAKSLVASRLKDVFDNARSFDYLMSSFSTPDEIFGPISISKLKNEDRYERLTDGYLPTADVVFLDEIWKAGPSIQNTLLTAVNEHIYHNGSSTVRIPMKTLIAASNELPAKNEGLEALWDRFLVRMVSNYIESESAFMKMIQGDAMDNSPLDSGRAITSEEYVRWQKESRSVGLGTDVAASIKALRKALMTLEKDDEGHMRFYISDRRWKKSFGLMQTSALLNGRRQIDMTDFILLIHCFWSDAESREPVIKAVLESMVSPILKRLSSVDREIKRILRPSESDKTERNAAGRFKEFDFFYYRIDDYPDGECLFAKWDYNGLDDSRSVAGIQYFDKARKRFVIHAMLPGRPLESKSSDGDSIRRCELQKCRGGLFVDGIPYTFTRADCDEADTVSSGKAKPVYQRVDDLKNEFATLLDEWRAMVDHNWKTPVNIFLSSTDMALVRKKIAEAEQSVTETEIKLQNLASLL